MTKVISISDEAYEELDSLKGKLSFTKVILELARLKKKSSLLEYAGMWSGKKWEKITKELKEERKMGSRRAV